jgi:DNA-binding NarL/FixJ family response regulator
VLGRVLVVEDDDFTRTLVSSLVASLGYEVCAQAASVTEAMSLAQEHRPNLVVLDLDLGEGPTGVHLAHGLRKLNPHIAIVMLSSYGDPSWMGQRRRPPIGARYVVKGEVSDTSVLAGALTAALGAPLETQDVEQTRPPLNVGQWEILRLVAAGYTNAEIARRRSLTEEAVKKAVTRLVRQLDIDPGEEGNARVLLTRAYAQMTGTVSGRRS